MSLLIDIRPAVPADAQALSRLVCEVLQASNLADYGAENIARVASHFSPDGVKVMLQNRLETWVAIHDGRVVGTASLDLSEDGQTAIVKTFFVDAGLQRAGIGSRLFGALSAKATECGAHAFTVRSSIAAQQFYENLGFVAVRDHWDGDERTIEMHG